VEEEDASWVIILEGKKGKPPKKIIFF